MGKDIFNVIRESDELGIVEIYGAIGTNYWNGTDIRSIQQQLLEVADCKKIVVRISSFGGDVSDALGIYELLRSLGRKVEAECIGMNASAATIVAMAGNVRRMSRYGFFLIHKCSSCAVGNENDIEAELESQRKVNERLVQLYVDRTGCDKEKIEELMEADNGNGRWLDIKEAMEYGFITEEIDYPVDIVEIAKGTVRAIINSKTDKNMKKSIIAFAALAALLVNNEVEAKDGKALFDDDQLKKINDGIEAANGKAVEAENARAEAENKLTAANTEISALKDRIKELEAIVDRIPGQPTPNAGSDTRTDGDSFADWYAKQDYVKEVKHDLGRE